MNKEPMNKSKPARNAPQASPGIVHVASRRQHKMRWSEDLDEECPVLRFSPTAWAKLEFFRDRGETEIGGFGISAPDDLLLIQEFATVRQKVTCVSVAFDDGAVADFFEAQVDAGRKPEQFGRIWLHSHPGSSPVPSGTDERTFAYVFGRCDWAVMFVLAQEGKSYARLRFNVGPGGAIVIPTAVDFTLPFAASDQAAWAAEYDHNIQPVLTADWAGDADAKPAQGLAEDSAPQVANGVDRQLLAALETGLGLDEIEAWLGDAEFERLQAGIESEVSL